MNHDATHSADWKTGCPKSCYRAELTADLRKKFYPLPTSWAHFKGTNECPKTQKGGSDMEEYITPNYETISTKQKRDLTELMQSSLLNAFTEQDYYDILLVFQRVIERIEGIEKGGE